MPGCTRADRRRAARVGGAAATLLTPCLTPCLASAQVDRAVSGARPYATVAITASGLGMRSSGPLDTYWTTSPGGALEVRTPFHVGSLGVSVGSTRYTARAAAQPDFRAYLVAVDWRLMLPGPRWLSPAVTFRAGDFLSTFDTVRTKGLAKESEIFIGGALHAGFPIAGRTRIALSLAGAQVLTSTPIRLAVVTAGLEQTVSTPRWLQRVLE